MFSDDKGEDKIKSKSPTTMNVLDTQEANSSDRTYTTSEIHEHQGTAVCSRTYTASEIEKECHVDDTFEVNEKAVNEEEYSMVNQEGEYHDNKNEMLAGKCAVSCSTNHCRQNQQWHTFTLLVIRCLVQHGDIEIGEVGVKIGAQCNFFYQ